MVVGLMLCGALVAAITTDPPPWGLVTILASGGLGTALIPRLVPRWNRAGLVRCLVLVVTTAAATRWESFGVVWFVAAAPTVYLATVLPGVIAATAITGLSGFLLASHLLVPPGGPLATEVTFGSMSRIGYVWLGSLLLVVVLGAMRRRTETMEEQLLHARTAHLRLDAILGALSTSVLVVDRNGWIRSANRAAELLTGRPTSMLRGILVDAVVHIGWEVDTPDCSGRSEIPVRGGEPIAVAFQIVTIGPGGDRLLMLHDLRPHYSALADLENRAIELQSTGESRSRFIASASHQLHTPMESLVSEAGRLLDRDDEPLDPRQRRYVSIINRNARRLMELLDDMLLLTTLDARMVSPQLDEVTVLRLLHEAGVPRPPELDAVAANKTIPTVMIDRSWVDRIFRETLDPVPFVGAQPLHCEHRLGPTSYRLSLASRRLEPGVDDAFVFSPHFPEHEGISPLSNTRLGLALARELARGLDGDLTTRFDEGQGFFVLELPLAGVRET